MNAYSTYETIWLASYGAVLGVISLYGIHRYVILALYLRHRGEPPRAAGRFEALPVVTVQLPVYNERYVARRLVRAVAALDYPRDRLEIQVLDDSTDDTTQILREEVERLRRAGYDVALHRRDHREGYKAGALREGLEKARGELIYILDADFVPDPGNLRSVIDFFTDETVGMVQTRWGHLNRERSPLTRVQAILLDGHFFLEQTARSRSGRFFHFNGTAGVWRRRCIEEAGGWEHDTLAEDLDLSFRAQLEGWRFLYLNDVVTPAELPEDMNGFKSQQHRWTKGAMQNARKLLGRVWASEEPLKVKVEATVQLTSNAIYPAVGLLCVLLLIQPTTSMAWWWGWGPSLVAFACATLSVLVFFGFSSSRTNRRDWWLDLAHLPLLLAVGLGMAINNGRAALEALGNGPSEFVRTPKFGDAGPRGRKRATYRVAVPGTAILEGLMAAGFAYWTVRAIWEGNAAGAVFPLLGWVGFGFVSWPSLRLWAEQHFNWRQAAVPVSGEPTMPTPGEP